MSSNPLKRFSSVFGKKSSKAQLKPETTPATTAESTTSPATAATTEPHITTLPATTGGALVTMSGFDKLNLKDAAHERRSIYQLSKSSTISDARIQEIINASISDVPSAFNSQSTRLVLLLKDQHDKFWDIVSEVLKTLTPDDKWESTNQRLTGFRGGYATILFYEDPAPVKALQDALPIYAERFPVWSEHTNAMHQFYLWTALSAEGLGANLQHYNPLPDQKAAAEFNIPIEWVLKAQLVFGTPAEGARAAIQPKEQKSALTERVLVRGL